MIHDKSRLERLDLSFDFESRASAVLQPNFSGRKAIVDWRKVETYPILIFCIKILIFLNNLFN